MKKILVILAIAFGCSSLVMEAAKGKRGCCKKSCATKQENSCSKKTVCLDCNQDCSTEVEEREILVKCPYTDYIAVPKTKLKKVIQKREVCRCAPKYKATEWQCPDGNCCCNGVIIETEEQLKCTHPNCVAAREGKHNHGTAVVREEVLTEAEAQAGEE